MGRAPVSLLEEQGKIAQDHGVTLCFGMQVNDMLHNPVKLKQIHDEIGLIVACNVDISHLRAQGIDPISSFRYLVHSCSKPTSRIP